MKKWLNALVCILSAILCIAGINYLYFIWENVSATLIGVFAAVFAAGFLLPLVNGAETKRARLFFLSYGNSLLKAFLISVFPTVIWHIVLLFLNCSGFWFMWCISVLISIAALCLIFWTGMILVYALSVQLGIRHRTVGILLGFVPIANIIMLVKIIRTTSAEVSFEAERDRLNSERESKAICKTRYPILLVHGVFFRDFKHINYWGRIPADLIANGAEIYYGEQNSASSVADSGKELYRRIETIVKESGCEKVNIIAHSKGGLDSRAAIANGAAPYIASLTTINTPHRGCQFADYLLNAAPEGLKRKVSAAYNLAAAGLGDKDPDFIAAVTDLTAKRCAEMDSELAVPDGIFTQSVASKMGKPTGGKFPLNFTYLIADRFDGDGDGLVSVESARWGENFTMLAPKRKRGISHGDMIDLNRENIPGFDVREFYVQLVSDLRERGL